MTLMESYLSEIALKGHEGMDKTWRDTRDFIGGLFPINHAVSNAIEDKEGGKVLVYYSEWAAFFVEQDKVTAIIPVNPKINFIVYQELISKLISAPHQIKAWTGQDLQEVILEMPHNEKAIRFLHRLLSILHT